ncbi:MAG: type IA DNA topoisomerase [Thermoprotei archaeon]|nr:MAG: type IA DNA topoisomerase [Thermoprotei archaeon]
MRDIDVLVVAEKPGVAKAFADFLSNGQVRIERINGVPVRFFKRNGEIWASIGVSGHLMDFDFPEEYNKWRSIDPRQLFFIKPKQKIRKGSWKYVKVLQVLGKRAREVILALDADVEGESIAFEVIKILCGVNPRIRFKRAWFNAVTKQDILKAVERFKDPDPKMANKAFARMQVDLTIGAAFTRTLTLLVEKKAPRIFPRGKFLSYGPCQTPVLYLVVKRALEREQFKKKKLYTLEAIVVIEGKILKLVYAKGPLEKKEDAVKILEAIKDEKIGVIKLAEYKHKEILPPEPLNTIELERRASRFLNIRSKEALDIAEDLYQNGLISYPRTETTIYPPTIDVNGIARNFSQHLEYGSYVRIHLIPRMPISPRQGKEDDKAHPPIHPVKAVSHDFVVKSFGSKAWRLYDLVVRHFLATLSRESIIENQRIVVDIGGYEFKIDGLKIVREGFYKIYPFGKPRERILPYVVEGDLVEVKSIKLVERETRPPPFLSEAEVLKLMKKYGIGTDATMQDHIHTNIQRKYFVIKNKRCIPTNLGLVLAATLHSIVPEIVEPEVRGKMEAELVRIAKGEKELEEVVDFIKSNFLKYYDKLVSNSHVLAEKLIEALQQVYWNKEPKKI